MFDVSGACLLCICFSMHPRERCVSVCVCVCECVCVGVRVCVRVLYLGTFQTECISGKGTSSAK